MNRSNGLLRTAVVLFLCVSMMLSPAVAQRASRSTSRLAAGDVLVLRVAERPDLNREMTVQADGTVSMPLVGEVKVGGLTYAEGEDRLLQALKRYYASLTSIELDVRPANKEVVYIIGQVGSPGKYNFGDASNVWEAIREAGGPTGKASLDQVRIVKDVTRGGATQVVNVAQALESGSVEKLPTLEGGDTVIIPQAAAVYTGGAGVNVFGEIIKPGVYKLQAKGDLMSALLLAGGPTRDAALGKIKIIRPRGDGTTVTLKIDLDRFLDVGDPQSNPMLQAGDSVNVPGKSGVGEFFKSNLGIVLNLLTTGVALATLIAVNN